MCEVNKNNFKQKLSEIKSSIDNSKFIAVDLEFSALYPLKNEQPSLFDSPAERYLKLKRNLEKVIPVQIGLTTFSYQPEDNIYRGTVYNFFIKPAAFPSLHTSFYFQSETINFLTLVNFNFNKFAYDSVPYIKKATEIELRKKIQNNELTEVQCNYRFILDEIFENEGETVRMWYSKAAIGEKLSLPTVFDKYKGNIEILYFVQKNFRSRFKNLWTKVQNGEFFIYKVSPNEYQQLEGSDNLEENLLSDLTGFTEVFQYLIKSKKPLVGHNCFQDILLMINSFECELPNSYKDFKKLSLKLFPVIFDTKSICYCMKNLIPEEKRFIDTGLSTLFEYFKNGSGRHIALNSPAIDVRTESTYGNYHEAGWDSYCSGYIFIRFAYLNIYQKYPNSKRFVSSELLGGMTEFKNQINIIRGSVPHINLDGEDPKSTRPPWLVIEWKKNKSINVTQVTSMLSSYGFVEIKKLSFKNNRALIAVDNFGNARRILNTFKTNSDFNVRQYNVFKHSPVVRAFLFSGITISGAILIWLTHSVARR